LIVLDFDFRLTATIADYDRRASEALSKEQPEATRLRKIADHLCKIAPTLAEKEQSLSWLLREQPVLAKLRASTLERGRANSPNFALVGRNGGALGNATPKLFWPVQVDGETELIEAFGVDRLAAGKQLVGYHIHPDTGRPWLWENNRSPEGVPLVELPPIDAGRWDALWREIASAGATLGFVEQGAGATKPFASDGAPRGIDLEPNIPPGTNDRPPPVETMRAMLEHLAKRDCFSKREKVANDAHGRMLKIGWRETGMALKAAYGDEIGLGLWEVTHLDEKARNDAPGQWASFASEPRPGHVTIGLIIKAAKDAGFVFASTRADATEPGYVSYGPFTMDADDGLTKEILKKTVDRLGNRHGAEGGLRRRQRCFEPIPGLISADPL
jgi:hypothetical protein